MLLWPLRTAGPGRIEQLLFWARKVTGWPILLTSCHCSKDTAPTEGKQVPSCQKKPAPGTTCSPSPVKFWPQQNTHSGRPDPCAGCPRRHLEARTPTASLPSGSWLESTLTRASKRPPRPPPQCHPLTLSRERGTDVPQLAQQFNSLRLPGRPTGMKAQSLPGPQGSVTVTSQT